MSLFAIKQYHSEVEKIIHYGGTKKETAIRNAFYILLNQYADGRDLKLIPEISLKTKAGKIVTPDGTLKDILRLDHGYWESKDESDDINEEIKKKFSKGYPNENILFEDSQTAVLIQQGQEVLRVPMGNGPELDKLLNRFISYERPEVKEFRHAIDRFKEDIPKVTEAIRDIINRQAKNETYLKALLAYHELCKVSINPDITIEDIKEMMVQHILSADIFNTIFDEPHFHQENNIARELNKVIETFFTGVARRETLGRIKHYYDTINATAAGIADHHEKQNFLKVVYENFYKAYNPKAADRLGIVYTPTEIVQFMVRSTDYLLHKHLGKTLDSKNVEILDPATGTGTFISEIIDYLPKHKLEYKYKNELHANEVAILPYYIANLNIEFVYKQKMGSYAEFENLCFVDTLDNTGFHWVGKQGDLFGVSAENAARIRKQNDKKISVIIGNPPYNANQQNENDNNKNREYPSIDKRIKETFINNSTAQKTKMYDMYSRFYRWAMDRLTDNGVIAFITNRSFIDSRTFDGFRKTVQQEYDFAYIIDTKSDVRANPKISGNKHNVFGIQAGVAVLLLVKTSAGKLKPHPCKIHYISMPDEWPKEEKIQWFSENNISTIPFETISPDKNSNWVNLTDNDWDKLLPIASKEVKSGKSNEAIFELNSLGIATNRDEWIYDFNESNLQKKVQYFTTKFNNEVERWKQSDKQEQVNDFVSRDIKWTEELEAQLKKHTKLLFTAKSIKTSSFRPFIAKSVYYEKILVHRLYQQNLIYPVKYSWNNKSICVHSISADHLLSCLATDRVSDLGYLKQGNGGTFCLPFYQYTSLGEQRENITNWALQTFHDHYRKAITKEDIFHYVYAVLHNPEYRKKYELNLKREFPRIPLYTNLAQWVTWGKELMDLHINYENAKPYDLDRLDKDVEARSLEALLSMQKAKLKAYKEEGRIVIDSLTELIGIPSIAWEYKLGNRSALEWVLDQYKEKKPSDPTIAEKFNTYKFSDYKEEVINLIEKVCAISVETLRIIEQMKIKNM